MRTLPISSSIVDSRHVLNLDAFRKHQNVSGFVELPRGWIIYRIWGDCCEQLFSSDDEVRHRAGMDVAIRDQWRQLIEIERSLFDLRLGVIAYPIGQVLFEYRCWDAKGISRGIKRLEGGEREVNRIVFGVDGVKKIADVVTVVDEWNNWACDSGVKSRITIDDVGEKKIEIVVSEIAGHEYHCASLVAEFGRLRLQGVVKSIRIPLEA